MAPFSGRAIMVTFSALAVILCIASEVHTLRMSRNALVFPPGSIVQLSIGVSSAISLPGNHTGQLSFGFQQNVQLPQNYSELIYPLSRRKRGVFIYDQFRNFFGSSVSDSTECLKKMICQTAATPFEGDLPEEILNFLLTPSNHEEYLKSGSFLLAEAIGRDSGDCTAAFLDCSQDPLEFITGAPEWE